MAETAQESWSAWAGRIASEWTGAFQQAWDDARSLWEAELETWAPARLEQIGQEFYDLIWGDGGALDLRDRVTARTEQARAAGVDVDALRAEAAAQLTAQGTPCDEIELDPNYIKGRCDFYAMGWMKGTAVPQPAMGFVPLLIGGLVVSIVALCWAMVRRDEAAVDNHKWNFLDRLLAAKVANPNLDLSNVEQAAAAVAQGAGGGSGGAWFPSPGASTGGSWLLPVGFVAVAVVAVMAMGRR